MKKSLFLAAALIWSLFGSALAQYDPWPHHGSLWILTTPEGADLPARCSETDFSLLIRLDRGTFDFSQAKPHGEDIRFSDDSGTPLAYQIDEWDSAQGTAAVWVKIPVIHGNARQEIRMHWGKPDAASESRGAAVFNESNGYVSVLHMNDRLADEAGLLQPADAGTTVCPGVIGSSRHFEAGKGIRCGEKIAGFPTGRSSHTSQAWIRAQQSNAVVLGWGNEQAQGKVTMQVASPPHINMDCYFSDGNVASGPLPTGEWVHVAYVYKSGSARLYVNGRLDGSTVHSGAPLAIRSPARMWIGGWYNDYRFVGVIDEVRISKVARSADWIRLEYENQKPQQTLVGTLVQPGNTLAVSPSKATIDEGKQATFTAQAGGAEKVYWILNRDRKEAVVASDRFSYTLDAGRVLADTSCVLQFNAVYPHEVKTIDVPVTIKDTIPEPKFSLKSPKTWNGRDTIEVLPVISNLDAMKAAGADKLHYQWDVFGGAVVKQVGADRLILKRSQFSGPIRVQAYIDNGGAGTIDDVEIQVTEPKSDPWVERTPEKDEKPEDSQFYARNDKNEGTLYCRGTVKQPADSVFLRLYADDKLISTQSQPLAADKSYTLAAKLKPGLIKYRIELGAKRGGTETIVHTASNLVCGDAYLIDGQSNALATDTGEDSPRSTSDWIRSYGGPATGPEGARLNLWCNPVWKARPADKLAELGYWGMELAKRLVVSQHVPIFIVNGAVGGTRIDQHQRSATNPMDPNTIYGRTLWRLRQARLTHGIRAVLWHQGENDQGAAGPTGRYGWETYQQYFVEMSAAWKEDYPNIQHYYVFQIWPNACAMGGRQGSGDMLREVQRTLPRLYSNLDVMSTLGIRPPGGCHYPLTGWAEFARLIQPLIERDIYGKPSAGSVTPPNLIAAHYSSDRRDAIVLDFDQPIVWKAALAKEFYLDGVSGKVASGVVSGRVLTLRLIEPSTARKITYLKEIDWSQERLLLGVNGIAALTFCNVPIQ